MDDEDDEDEDEDKKKPDVTDASDPERDGTPNDDDDAVGHETGGPAAPPAMTPQNEGGATPEMLSSSTDGNAAPVEPQVPGGNGLPPGPGRAANPIAPDPNQSTTKPRQMPGGGSGDGDNPFANDDEDSDEGSDSGSQDDSEKDEKSGGDAPPWEKSARLTSMARMVKRENPDLPFHECVRLAHLAESRYLEKVAEDASPLTYGNAPSVKDGPYTQKVKDWVNADDGRQKKGDGIQQIPGLNKIPGLNNVTDGMNIPGVSPGQHGFTNPLDRIMDKVPKVDGGNRNDLDPEVSDRISDLKSKMPTGAGAAGDAAGAGEAAAGAGTAAEAAELLPLLAL